MQDNYQIQARQARERFLTYDLQEITEKHRLFQDEQYLYLTFFSLPYRIEKCSGKLQRLQQEGWTEADSHGEVMTVLDLLCDSSPARHPGGTLKTMQSFGYQFHQALGEQDPRAALFDPCPQKLSAACQALGGVPFSGGDVAYTIPVFEDLCITLQFWQGDEEFAPRLRFLWDENALQYLKYETMYYAVDVLIARLRQYL